MTSKDSIGEVMLIGQRYTLHPLRIEHAEEIVNLLADENVTHHLDIRLRTLEGIVEFIQKIYEGTNSNRVLVMVIIPNNKENIIGFIRIDLFPTTMNSFPSLHYMLNPCKALPLEHISKGCMLDLICLNSKYWGMGIAKECCDIIFSYLKMIGLYYVISSIKESNTVALHLAEKFKFKTNTDRDLKKYDIPLIIGKLNNEVALIRFL